LGSGVADVFISYKTERRNAAQHLSRILELNGYSVWFDYGLLSGSDFGPQIERELRAAKAVVVLWCSLSHDSRWVLEEAHLAERLGTLTPVWLESVELPLGFGRADTIDLSNWDGSPRSPALDRLLNEVGRRVGRDAEPSFRGLQHYEETWRGFGAPPLSRFALVDPIAEEARSFGIAARTERTDAPPPRARTVLGSGALAAAAPRPAWSNPATIAAAAALILAGGAAAWYWTTTRPAVTEPPATQAASPPAPASPATAPAAAPDHPAAAEPAKQTAAVPEPPKPAAREPVQPPYATFQRSNSDWTLTLSFLDPVAGISWRIGDSGPFKDTGFADMFDQRTRRRMPNPSVELDPDQPATTIQVRAVDVDGNIYGPFPIAFDPDAELERGNRKILEMTGSAWLAFRDYNGLLVYFSHLITYRCAIRELRIGIDTTTPTKVIPLGDCDPKHPFDVPENVPTYLKLPPATQMVSVELTYRDGSVSETKTFRPTGLRRE